MSKLILLFTAIFCYSVCMAQPSFLATQKSNYTYANVTRLKEDTLKKQFAAKGFQWPPKQIYIRSFKYDSQLEVWVRNDAKEDFKLFKTYKICALAGTLGPKRMEGDYQVPEGFYQVSRFNPTSDFHMSLGLNYPNQSDKKLSDSLRPGGGIYIHGSCITVGCIPIRDDQIEEVYLLAAQAKGNGQDFIPVHIFPIRYGVKQSEEYFEKFVKDNPAEKSFSAKLKEVYDYFEKEKKLPIIVVNSKGEYTVM